MLITESKLRQIVKEEYSSMMKEASGGIETRVAKQSLQKAIEEYFPKFYEQRKTELAKEGKKIKNEDEIKAIVEKEKNEWLRSYSRGMRGGTEDDLYSSPSRIHRMPKTLQRIAMMADADVPNWDIANNMYDGF